MSNKENAIFWKKATLELKKLIKTYGEIGGTIGIGKSELLKLFIKILGKNLIAFHEFYNKEKLKKFYKNPEKNKDNFQNFIRKERLNLVRKIKNIRKDPIKKNKLIIVDRLMLGEMAFTLTNLRSKWKDEKELIFNKMKSIGEGSSINPLLPDFVIILIAPSHICKERIQLRGLAEELNIKNSYLLDIQNSYKEIILYENILPKDAKVFFIDYEDLYIT